MNWWWNLTMNKIHTNTKSVGNSFLASKMRWAGHCWYRGSGLTVHFLWEVVGCWGLMAHCDCCVNGRDIKVDSCRSLWLDSWWCWGETIIMVLCCYTMIDDWFQEARIVGSVRFSGSVPSHPGSVPTDTRAKVWSAARPGSGSRYSGTRYPLLLVATYLLRPPSGCI